MTALDEIKDTFALFDDWEDRYRYLIDLGKDLPSLTPAERVDENLIQGCQSQVWLVHEYDATTQTLSLRIDSDAHIVRGLSALVLAACDQQSVTTLAATNIESIFEELDLLQHLSPTRGNGLRAMIAKIQGLAIDLSQG